MAAPPDPMLQRFTAVLSLSSQEIQDPIHIMVSISGCVHAIQILYVLNCLGFSA